MLGGGFGNRVGHKVGCHAADAGQNTNESAHYAGCEHIHKLLFEFQPGKAETLNLVVGFNLDFLIERLGSIDQLADGIDTDQRRNQVYAGIQSMNPQGHAGGAVNF